jgi:hypothetical protein
VVVVATLFYINNCDQPKIKEGGYAGYNQFKRVAELAVRTGQTFIRPELTLSSPLECASSWSCFRSGFCGERFGRRGFLELQKSQRPALQKRHRGGAEQIPQDLIEQRNDA